LILTQVNGEPVFRFPVQTKGGKRLEIQERNGKAGEMGLAVPYARDTSHLHHELLSYYSGNTYIV
jgi:hypothetical protein